ncbi:MAG: tripartite tricarboxylate transporter permease [Thermodesulfobacteriota bacterium]
MFEAFLAGAGTVLTWKGMLYASIGATVGYVFGFLPGLGASVAVSLIIPITYGMTPMYAMIMLAGVLGGISFGGSITSIVINTPGEGANAATCLDGYAMAQQGRAGEALGASAASGFLGHALGIIVLIAIIPAMQKLVLFFGPPEWFALGVGGLCLIAAVSGGSLLGGIISGAAGLLLSMHGVNPVVGSPRFTFGQMWLWDGVPLLCLIIGIMALAEMIVLFTEQESISKSGTVNMGGVWSGVRETLKRLPLVVLAGMQGVVIGAIPGVGGNVSSWIAYAQAKAMSKHPETFGKGNIEGVIGPESANDSVQAGALMPLLSLGIPGSPSTAVLLGGLIMHGLNPGQEMLQQNLDVVFALTTAHLFGSLVTVTIGLWAAKYFAYVTTISSRILVPMVSVLCLMGTYATRGRVSDIAMTIIFTVVGYAMIKCNIPRVPMILGLILGPLVERSYQVCMQLSDGSLSIFLTRPITVVFLSLIPVSLFASKIFGLFRPKKKNQTS